MTPRGERRRPSAERAPRSRLVLRAISWRLGSSIAFFVVAAVAVTAAAAGPLYLTAADRSVVGTQLAAQPAEQTGLSLTEAPTGNGLKGLLTAGRAVPGGSGSGATKLWGPPILTTDVSSALFSPVAGRPDSIDFVARTGACAEVHLASGHCPTSPDEVALSSRSAGQLRVHVGSKLTIPPHVRGASKARPLHLVVSGLYLPGDPRAAIWWGTDYFTFGVTTVSGGESLDDGWLTAAGALRLSTILQPTSWLEFPLHTSAISPGTIGSVLSELAGFPAQVQAPDGVVVGSSLPGVLAAAQAQESSARTIVLVVALQLVLLALLVLYSVAKATSALRSEDVRVAELRGLPRRSIAALALREPVLLLLAALPAGAALAWFVVFLIDRGLLGMTAPSFDVLAVVFAVGTFAAGVIAAALGSRVLLRVRLSEESIVDTARRRSRNVAVVDALGLALSAAGVAELVARGSHQAASADPLALIGPELLALGIGILGARLLIVGADSLARLTRWSHRVATGLAARSIGRRENVARQVLVPTIAAALLSFSVGGLLVSRHNEQVQAGFEVGAPVVLQADVKPGVNFLAAVRKADPSGREAMAVATVTASFGQTVAVDSSRLAAIAAWPVDLAGRTARAIAAQLRPPTAPVITVPSGNHLTVTLDLLANLTPRPDLQLDLFDDLYQSATTVDFGMLQPGLHTYSGSLAGACSQGCRLDQFTLLWNHHAHYAPSDAYHVGLVFKSLSDVAGVRSTVVPMNFTSPGDWTAAQDTTARSSSGGLEVTSDLAAASTPPTVSPADVPSSVPAVVTSSFASLNADPSQPGIFPAVGIDENQVNVKDVATVPALPELGSDGTMIDLGFAETVQTGPVAGAQFQIWCSHPPPHALLARLQRGGITVTGSSLSSSVLHGFQRSGPSLGFDLFGLAAGGAVLLALGSLLFATASTARRRGIELTGLGAVGVSRRTLHRSVMLESLMVSVAGALLGWGAGVLGTSLAIASLPEFNSGRIGPPLELGLPWAVLVGVGVAVLVLLIAVALISAWLVMRQVRPDRLRLSA